MKKVLTFVFFSFLFYLSKEILVFNEEIILLCASFIMFTVFVTAGWSALESTLVTRSNEIFFIFDDLYALKIKKLTLFKDVFLKKQQFKLRLISLTRTVSLNILYSKFLNTVLEDFFYLYSYSYLILKEVTTKELMFFKSFFNKKVILKDSDSNFIEYFLLSNQLNSATSLNNDVVSYNANLLKNGINVVQLGINKESLINNFLTTSTNSMPNISALTLKNLKTSAYSKFSNDVSLNLQLQLNYLFFNYWNVSTFKVLYYFNYLNNTVRNFVTGRYFEFFNKKQSLVTSVNFNSFLSLLNQGSSNTSLEFYLFNKYLMNFLISINFISPNFSFVYYKVLFNKNQNQN